MSRSTPPHQPPIQTGQPVGDEHRRLRERFAKLDETQLETLDGAGKRIIELCTALLGTLLVVTALGENFPSIYLQGNALALAVAVFALLFFVMAILTAFVALYPRRYRHYEHNLTRLQAEWDRLMDHKSTWITASAVIFVLGVIALALLVTVILFSAL
jgi:hypothetical protein